MAEQWQTESLLARAPRPADHDGYLDLFLDPAIGARLRPAPLSPFTEAEILGMLIGDEAHWDEHGFGAWTLLARESGELVGRGGLRWTELADGRAVELPWAIASAHWNRGLATEAARAAVGWAQELRLPEAVALILAGNGPSRRVAEKAGLKLDGEATHAGLPHLIYRWRLLPRGRPKHNRNSFST